LEVDQLLLAGILIGRSRFQLGKLDFQLLNLDLE
jgi:hypothetical protein